MDHLIAIAAGGLDSLDNLALACFFCNRRRSFKQFAIDPETGYEVSLFNPRNDRWADHFIWSADGLRIVPLTATGRATAELLAFNRERVLFIREADIAVRRHPPEDDPIQKREA
jgi:5-methylcytosine-specific restriction endonuclease McrA